MCTTWEMLGYRCFFLPARTIKGIWSIGPFMRRRGPDGRWQYRTMTAEEDEEFTLDHWW